MANVHRGEVEWKIGKVKHLLRLGNNAMVELENIIGMSFPELVRGLIPPWRPARSDREYEETDERLRRIVRIKGQKSMKEVADPVLQIIAVARAVLWASFPGRQDGRLSLEEVGDLMDDAGTRESLNKAADVINASLEGMMPSIEEEKDGDPLAPSPNPGLGRSS